MLNLSMMDKSIWEVTLNQGKILFDLKVNTLEHPLHFNLMLG